MSATVSLTDTRAGEGDACTRRGKGEAEGEPKSRREATTTISVRSAPTISTFHTIPLLCCSSWPGGLSWFVMHQSSFLMVVCCPEQRHFPMASTQEDVPS